MSGNQEYNDLHSKGLYSKELEEALLKLQKENIEEFTDLILGVLRYNPEQAVKDGSPASKKLSALNKMQEYLITTERYEDCAFVKTLIEKIQDAE